jgi:hypothetical protein
MGYEPKHPRPATSRRAFLILGGSALLCGLLSGSTGITPPSGAGGSGGREGGTRSSGGFTREVLLDDFYDVADGDDYSPALRRALQDAVPRDAAVRLSRHYRIASTVSLPDGSSIVGAGVGTGLLAPPNAPVQLLAGTRASRVRLASFLIDGGVTRSFRPKDFTRGVRFSDCSDIELSDLTVRNCADWAVAFERCSRATVVRHTHTGGGLGRPGGRDAIHLLDCSDALVEGATIHSGDDCVGITSETVGSRGIRVRDIAGRSDIGSIVACNEEGSTTFPTENVTIERVRALGGARNIVRVCTINPATSLSSISISDVAGSSQLHGIHVSGSASKPVSDVRIVDVDVSSGSRHGVYLADASGFDVAGFGLADLEEFDGMHFLGCDSGLVRLESRRCSGLLQLRLNTCSDMTVANFPPIGTCADAGRVAPAKLRIDGSRNISVTGDERAMETLAPDAISVSNSGSVVITTHPGGAPRDHEKRPGG